MRRLVLVGLLAAVVAAVPGAVRAQGADAQGWWWTAAQQGLPAPPSPPDVAADDLLVQGGDVPREVGQPTAPTAVAAVRFAVPVGSDVGALTLLVGAGARADDVRAYPATSTWVPSQGGPLAEAPSPDVSRYSAGHLSADGAALIFTDIGRLVTEQGLLSVVLVPGPTDRAVLHHPGPAALAVSPPAPSPATPSPEPAFTPAPVAPEPAAVALPPTTVLPPVLQPPAVAFASPPTVAKPVLVAAAPMHRLVADDARARWVALAELALLLLTFGLLGQGPLARTARLLGTAPVATPERGIGRFRAVREGAPPRL